MFFKLKYFLPIIFVTIFLNVSTTVNANPLAWSVFKDVATNVAANLITDFITGNDNNISELESKIAELQKDLKLYKNENHADYDDVARLINEMGSKIFKLSANVTSNEKRIYALEIQIKAMNAKLGIGRENFRGVSFSDQGRSIQTLTNVNNKLNILVFNASTNGKAHNRFSGMLKSELPSAKISSQLGWVDKFTMEHTLIFYQGQKNKKNAVALANWLPGKQIVQDYIKNPSGFFGFAKNRDLIIFIGQDYKQMSM